jgi:hypothetical protein
VTRLFAIALALFAVAAAGAPACSSKRAQQACRLQSEAIVAALDRAPSAVSLAALGARDGFAAAWSAGGETWCARIGARGEPQGEALRIGRAADGGAAEGGSDGGVGVFWPGAEDASFAAESLAVAPRAAGGAIVGVLERRSESRPGGAFAALVSSDFGAVTRVVALGPAGPFSSRITAVEWRGGLVVAWHDAAVEASAIHIAAIAANGAVRPDAIEIPGGHPAFSPSLAADGDDAVLVWTESRSTNAAPRFDILAAALLPGPALGPIETVASSRYIDPSPAVVPAGDGFAAAFRDNRDNDKAPEYYFVDLDRSGGVRHGAVRISRADGPEGPRLARLGSTVFGVQIRSFSASLLVGMNRFGANGEKRGGEFQVYADKSDFTRVDVAPGADGVLLLYGEDRDAGGRDAGGRILAGAVTCRE